MFFQFLKMEMLRTQFPEVPILMLSASIRDRDITKVTRTLNIEDCKIFINRIQRNKIFYKVKTIGSFQGSIINDIIHFIKRQASTVSFFLNLLTTLHFKVKILAQVALYTAKPDLNA